jgi:hypothetical protein
MHFVKLPIVTGNPECKDFTWVNPDHVASVTTTSEENECWVNLDELGYMRYHIDLSPEEVVQLLTTISSP